MRRGGQKRTEIARAGEIDRPEQENDATGVDRAVKRDYPHFTAARNAAERS
jgi:hypothetical protein